MVSFEGDEICQCTDWHGCIMKSSLSGEDGIQPFKFSECSLSQFQRWMEQGSALCLLNIPSTPEFSFDGNLTNSPFPPVLARRGSRIVSPASPVSESSSYQGSMPGSGRSEQDSYTTHSERSFADKQDPRKYFSGSVNQAPGRGANRNDLEEALLRSGYFLPEYKH